MNTDKQKEEVKNLVTEKVLIDFVNAYWKFDEDQQPTSSWHEKNHLIEAIQYLFKNSQPKELPKQLEPQNNILGWTPNMPQSFATNKIKVGLYYL